VKGQEVTDISGKLEEITQEELYIVLSSPNTIRVIKSRIIGLAEHVA
jgi:hypothetical protein